jgi:predicted ATPase
VQAKKGFGKIFFITGEAGVGKTRLAMELAKLKDDLDFEFLTGQCIYREGTDPYMPFIDMFKGYLSEHPYLAKAIQASFRTPGWMIFDFYSIDDKKYTSKTDAILKEETAEPKKKLKKKRPKKGSKTTEMKEPKGPYGNIDAIGGDLDQGFEIPESSLDVLESHLHDGKHRMYETISRLINGIANKKTLVLFIDDVHWADEASLHLLHYMARNIKNQPILIVCAYRTEEVDITTGRVDPLREFISRLGTENLFSTVTLHRLDQEETKEIVGDLLDVKYVPSEFANLIYKETEGNPFFIKEVLKSLIDDKALKIKDNRLILKISPDEIVIPLSIQELIKLRLQKLDYESVDVLEYATVIGNEFKFDLLNNIIDISESKLINILGKLAKVKIIEELDDEKSYSWQFTHNKIHEVIYNNITDNKKKLIHLRLAKYLEDVKIDNLDEVVYDLAYHFYKGVDFDRALSYSIEGGEKAMRLFAYKEALDLYNIGLNSVRLLDERLAKTAHYKEKKIDVLSRLGMLNRISGDMDKSLTYFEQMIGLCDEIDDPQRKAKTYLEIGRIYEQKMFFKEAQKYFKKSLSLSKEIKDDLITGEGYQGLGLIFEHEGDLRQAVLYYSKSLKYAESNHDSVNLAKLHSAFGRVYNYKGDHQLALKHKKKSIDILKEINDLPELAKEYNSLGLTYLDMGKIDLNIEYNEKCIELADKISDLRIKGIGLSTGVEGYVKSKDLEKALDYAASAFDIFKKLEDREMIALSFMNFGIIFENQKEWDSAIDNFKSALELLENLNEPNYIAECYRHFSKIYKGKGEMAKSEYYSKKAQEIVTTTSPVGHIRQISGRTQQTEN